MASQQRPGAAAPRKPSPAVYRRRRLVAAVIALVLIGLLVAAGFFIASLFGAGTTEGQDGGGSGKAAAQGPTTGSEGKDQTAAGSDSGKKDSGPKNSGSGDKETAKDDDAAAEAAADEDGEPSQQPSAESSADPTQSTDVCSGDDVTVSAATDKDVYAADKNPVLTLSVSNDGDRKCTINLGTSRMEYLITSGQDRVFSSTDCQVEASDNKQTLKPGEKEKAKLTWERNRTTENCEPVESEPQPGTYVLVTKLGDRTSEEVSFTLN